MPSGSQITAKATPIIELSISAILEKARLSLNSGQNLWRASKLEPT